VLSLSIVASAQRRNDRNDRNNRNNDRYGNGSSNRNLRATVVNLKNRSERFERTLDRALDRSRYDERRREDNLNELAERFKDAANDLEDEYDNRRDYRDSADEARRVLQYGSQLDRAVSRLRLDRSVQREWSQIRRDLQTLSSAYNSGYNNGRYDDYRNSRRNDDYRNRDQRRDKRDKRNKRNKRNKRGNYNPY
jgi:hypothetical protein